MITKASEASRSGNYYLGVQYPRVPGLFQRLMGRDVEPAGRAGTTDNHTPGRSTAWGCTKMLIAIIVDGVLGPRTLAWENVRLSILLPGQPNSDLIQTKDGYLQADDLKIASSVPSSLSGLHVHQD